MAIEADDFRTFEAEGLRIERDTSARTKLLSLASRKLAEKRRGTELDDHLSGDIICPRRSVLDRLDALKKTRDSFIDLSVSSSSGGKLEEDGMEYSRTYDRYYDPEPLIQDLDAQKVIFFGFGHSLQEFIFGDDTETPQWDDEDKLWYSPDGVDIFGTGDYHEFKTTRASPIRKDYRDKGMSVEDVLVYAHDAWFQYILAVMKRTGIREYYLTIGWLFGADVETFKVTATDEIVEKNEEDLRKIRVIRRASLAELVNDDLTTNPPSILNLPSIRLRKGAFECDYCHWAAREPCASQIPGLNAEEKLKEAEAKKLAKANK